MGKKISPVTCREWAEAYEHGESYASIAKRETRDVRTVKKMVEQTHREQHARNAQAEIVKEALQRHQKSLMEVLDAMKAAVADVPAPTIEPREERDGTPAPMPLPSGLATLSREKGWVIALHAEATSSWEILGEHLKRDPVWKVFDAWKRAMAAHIAARWALKKKAINLIKAKTSYRLVQDGGEPPYVLYHPTVDELFSIW